MQNVLRGGVAVIDTGDAMGLAMHAAMMESAARRAFRKIDLAFFTALEREGVTATYRDLKARGLQEEYTELLSTCIGKGSVAEREALKVHMDQLDECRAEAAWARAELAKKPESVRAEVDAKVRSDMETSDA